MVKKRIIFNKDPIFALNLDDLFLRNKYQDKFNKGPKNFNDFTLAEEMDLVKVTAKWGIRGTFFLPGPEPFDRAVKDGVNLRTALKSVIALDMEIGAHGYKHNDIDTAENYFNAKKSADFIKKNVFSITQYPYSVLIWRSPGCNWNKQIAKNIAKSGFIMHSDKYLIGPTTKISKGKVDEIKWNRLLCDLPFYFKGGSCKRWFKRNKISLRHKLLRRLTRVAKIPLMHVWCQRGYKDGRILNKRFQAYEDILKDKIRKRISVMPLGDLYLSWKYPIKVKKVESQIILDNSKNKQDSVIYLQFNYHDKLANRFYVLEDGTKYSIGRFALKKGEIRKISLKSQKVIANPPNKTLICISRFTNKRYGVCANKDCTIKLNPQNKKLKLKKDKFYRI
ncbi:hypothetical protein KY315_02355, partial [Candidatus Woesearchaeota archaeon]|nr:hypothetical protein [Candidatus Woesearchaeota archaeon]